MSGILVAGVGNAWRCDDGAGPAVARRLGDDRRVLVHEGEPVDLIEAWADADEVVLVDAVSSGAPPGTVHRIDALSDALPGPLTRGSTHAFGLADTIELARVLDRLPPRLHVYGIEGERFTAGDQLSPAVEAAVVAVASELRERLELRTVPERTAADALAAGLAADGRGPVERRETHGSTVLLTAHRAYKLKKAVHFDFVDLRTPAARRHACEREAELNDALAPGLVLGVRGVVPAEGGGCDLGAPDDPAAVDWAVEMVRFDERCTLAARLAAGGLDAGVAGTVGRRLAAFHRAAEPVTPGGAGGAATVAGNLEALLALLGDGADAGVALGLQRFTRSFSRGWSDRLAARAAAGRIVDGHGDLRAEHVLIEEAGIRFVDRLEIDELRVVDVADDLAFLLMDLEHLGAATTAASVLEGYRAAGGDRAPDELTAYFGVHRAAVRAKVALLRDDARPGDAHEFLVLARRMAWRARGPLVLLVTGPPATGKSTLAAALAATSGLPLLSSDALRKAVGAPPVGYSEAMRAAVYDELGRRAVATPAVIVDATFGDKGLQDAFFARCASRPERPVLAIECVLGGAVRAERARAREFAGGDPSDAGPREAADLAARHVGVGGRVAGHVVLETSARVEELVDRVEAWLDGRTPASEGV